MRVGSEAASSLIFAKRFFGRLRRRIPNLRGGSVLV
jgi:hypothetical protein